MLSELEEKVRKLEEERGMKQYSSGRLQYSHRELSMRYFVSKDSRKRYRGLDGHSERKRKTVTVSDIR